MSFNYVFFKSNQRRIIAVFFIGVCFFMGYSSYSSPLQQNSGQGNGQPDFNSQEKESIEEIEKMLFKRMKEDQKKMDLAKKAALQNGGNSGNNTQSISIQSVNLPTTAEYNALMDFYQATNGANWTNKTGWSSANPSVVQDVSGFAGVSTNANGNVIGIYLPVNNIVGELPESFGDLIYLEQLYLFSNNLYQKIPQSIGNLVNLKGLYLNSCRLNWHAIPSTIGNLVNLEYLSLHSNYLIGQIPSSIGNLTKLKELNLFFTKLEGEIPSSIGNLHQLQFLLLMGSNLTGPIPASFSNLTQLYSFRVRDNQLTGPIPDFFCNFPNLHTLTLYNNKFTGSLPNCLFSKSFSYFLVSNNNFSAGSVIEMATHFSNTSDYLPQNQSTDTLYIQVKAGNSVQLSTSIGTNTTQASSYRWIKDGTALFNDFRLNAYNYQDTTRVCQLNGVGIDNCDGVYYVEITNPALPSGTVLKGPPTVVKTIPMFDITICDLYDPKLEVIEPNDLLRFTITENEGLISCNENTACLDNLSTFGIYSSSRGFINSISFLSLIEQVREIDWSG